MQPTTHDSTETFVDILEEALSPQQTPLLQLIMALWRFFCAGAILILADRVIVTPPPFPFSSAGLVLPAWLWFFLLAFTAAISLIGMRHRDDCLQSKGAWYGFWVLGMMVFPIWPKAPVFSALCALALFPHAIVAIHLRRECRRASALPHVPN